MPIFMTICLLGAENWRRKDRQDAANSRFLQFCERAWKRFSGRLCPLQSPHDPS